MTPFHCTPGEEGTHEKDRVEHEGGRFRRTHLVPPPHVASIAELSETLAEIDELEDDASADAVALARRAFATFFDAAHAPPTA